jgi:UDP-glucuronate 4-epimerase
MKVLVTGGAGFIGAHVARALLARGEEVVLLDNFDSLLYPASAKESRIAHMFVGLKRPRLITGDILDGKLLATIFAEEKFDKVFHCAALANPGRSVGAAVPYTTVNVVGTLNVLEAARRHDIVQVVFAGSSSVYDDEQTPFSENSYPLRPKSPYGASKAAAEAYCAMWHELYGVPITVLRFFSVYGPWGRPDMAPHIFAKCLLNDQTLEVTPWRQRDFTYIDDIVAGVLVSFDRKLEYEVINLGRGAPVELTDFIAALEAAAKKKARIVTRRASPGEMRVTYADIAKARQLLDYEPKVSVEEGTLHLVTWLKKHPEW